MKTYTGIIRKVEITIKPPYNPYKYWGGGTMEIWVEGQLDLVNQTESHDGITAYFKKMVGTHHIASGGPFAINCYSINRDCPWVVELNKDKSVASPGTPSANKLELKLQVGDTLTINARPKGEVQTSRKGNRYVALTHVKYVNPEVPTSPQLA